jgi:membrane protein DedA with SNARE-associated domain
MDRLLWEMIGYYLVTPTVPYLWPWRLSATAAATTTTPWWLVVIIANAAGAVGMLPIAWAMRRLGADRLDELTNRWPLLGRLHRWCHGNMFLLQIALNFTLLPDYVSCALAGGVRYPLRRLWLAQLLGRTTHNLPIVLGGAALVQHPWFLVLRGFLEHPLVIAAAVLVTLIFLAIQALQSAGESFLTTIFCEEEN